MHFSERPPSTAWEAAPLLESPHSHVWAWFKPGGVPNGVCFRIPEETYRDPCRRQALTIRTLLRAVGIDGGAVSAWTMFGRPAEALEGTIATLDTVIPEPPPGGDPTIGVYLNSASGAALSGSAPTPPTSGSAPDEVFARMEAAWEACLQLELQLAAVAKQLNAMAVRLNSLNRDLSSEEFRYADQQDKREWQDARRWLRDIVTRVSRAVKDHSIGQTSAAGRRNGYETIYRQHVAPRQAFDGIQQAERDFESYRKSLQTLLNNMIAVHGTAAQDGDRRAQLVLTRITARVRAARSKRS